MTTVLPAKATALPELAIARAIDLVSFEPVGETLLVPGDDEQRVVDADPEPDHRSQRRRHGRYLGHMTEQGDQREPRGNGDQRRRDRDHHRDRGAEGREQDQDRDADADRLARVRRGLGNLQTEIAPRRDLEPGVGRRRGRVDDRVGVVVGEVTLADRQRERDVGDLLVLGELIGSSRREGTGSSVDAVDRLDRLHGLLDRGLVRTRAQLGPVGDDHDRHAAVLLLGQLVGEQVGRCRRSGAGQGEVVAGSFAGDSRADDQGNHCHGPDREHDPPVAHAEVADSVQQRAHIPGE